MYDRAPRLLSLAALGSTEEHVGPGSYQVSFPKRQATGGCAPFLSSAARQSAFTGFSHPDEVVPGPADYDVSEAQHYIKGCRSLQNREKRFKEIISDNPGPASYHLSYPRTLAIMKRQILEKSSRTSAVSKSVYVPSIPSCGKSYGYHINEDDSIIKCSPPDIDSTIGPAYYKPQFEVPIATLKYRGVHFGNTSGRRELPPKLGPGPGQYDITQKKKLYCENINIKKDQQKNCYSSFIPRFYEIIALQEEKKGVPGPGKYDIQSQFQKTGSTTMNVNDGSPAFLSQCERFVPAKSITPAPGTYNETRTAFKYWKKTSGLKNASFGQSTPRFMQDSRAEEMPGPGSYNILNDTISTRNLCLKKKKSIPFGSSVPRDLFIIQEDFSTPSPCDYQVDKTPDKLPNLTNKNAAFLSRTERMSKKRDMVIPAPGSYDVHKSYEMSQVKHNYMPPRSFVAAWKHSSFLSATPRYVGKITDSPGPGTYNPVLRKSCPIHSFVKSTKRFEDPKEDFSPGPTTYEVC
uniref:sperm-tail PG-rich repeat-containing protein 2 n=1 Tax=Jaculus jaculus TaxID=51337 RepID=UPI001E1B16AB|nr:sperm-tail PG-rich repeat-containing protein 2 [Jaculus jaculus]